MSIHSYPSISYTFYDPHRNRYYTTYVTTDDATRFQTDRRFVTDIFYRIKNIQDVLQDVTTSVTRFMQPSSNGQVHALPNQQIVYLSSSGSSPRWFTYYPTPIPRLIHPRKKKPFVFF